MLDKDSALEKDDDARHSVWPLIGLFIAVAVTVLIVSTGFAAA